MKWEQVKRKLTEFIANLTKLWKRDTIPTDMLKEHVKQNDEECLLIIQQVGCFARSAMLIAEMKTGRYLTAEQINDIWYWGKQQGIIDSDDNLIDSAKLATHTLNFLGDSGKFCEIATKNNDVTNYYAWAKKAGYTPDYYINKILQNGRSMFHFRVVDADGNLIEDPHNPVINVVRELYTICYKYFNA